MGFLSFCLRFLLGNVLNVHVHVNVISVKNEQKRERKLKEMSIKWFTSKQASMVIDERLMT